MANAILLCIGMSGFEPPTPRPPDAYSNQTELHPEMQVQRYYIFIIQLSLNKKLKISHEFSLKSS